jgi:Ala-tRNA(Pro) deacylase
MSDLENNIFRMLITNNIEYRTFEHKAVYTCADMAKVLDVRDSSVLKSLVLITEEGDAFLLILAGDKRFDPERIAKLAKAKGVRFARSEEVKRLIGCEIGCVPPFGSLTPIKIYLSRAILQKKRIFFNPGIHTKSIEIEPKYLVELCKPMLI